jgi:hypothetical protein
MTKAFLQPSFETWALEFGIIQACIQVKDRTCTLVKPNDGVDL